MRAAESRTRCAHRLDHARPTLTARAQPSRAGWYVFAAFFVLAAMHLSFNANPMLTSAMLKEKEAARKAK